MNKGKKFYRMIKILLILLIVSSFLVFAQSGLEMSVSGFVRDVDSNAPIPGIEVIIFKVENGNITDLFRATSNRNGFYKVRFLKAGQYRFAISLHRTRMILMEMISNGGSDISDIYKFEIKEGKNIYLKIFLGESNLPKIRKEISIDGSEINFTMIYRKKLQEISKFKSEDEKKVCDGLTIVGPNIQEVPDDYIIGYPEPDKDEIKFGSFWYDYNLIAEEAECKDLKCEFSKIEVYVDTCIFIHSVKFFEEKYKTTEDCAKCFRKCTLVHENSHSFDFFSIACEEWLKFLNELNLINCCNNVECINEYYKKILEMHGRVKKAMKGTEDRAEEEEKKCESKCPQGCK